MTTKEQERKALAKIQEIIIGLGENSYVGTAFRGCIEIARENIENDFACSLLERKEAAEAAEDTLRAKVAELNAQITAEKKARMLAEECLAKESERANRLVVDYTDMKKLADSQERATVEAIGQANAYKYTIEERDDEIIKLKAKLYDLICK